MPKRYDLARKIRPIVVDDSEAIEFPTITLGKPIPSDMAGATVEAVAERIARATSNDDDAFFAYVDACAATGAELETWGTTSAIVANAGFMDVTTSDLEVGPSDVAAIANVSSRNVAIECFAPDMETREGHVVPPGRTAAIVFGRVVSGSPVAAFRRGDGYVEVPVPYGYAMEWRDETTGGDGVATEFGFTTARVESARPEDFVEGVRIHKASYYWHGGQVYEVSLPDNLDAKIRYDACRLSNAAHRGELTFGTYMELAKKRGEKLTIEVDPKAEEEGRETALDEWAQYVGMGDTLLRRTEAPKYVVLVTKNRSDVKARLSVEASTTADIRKRHSWSGEQRRLFTDTDATLALDVFPLSEADAAVAKVREYAKEHSVKAEGVEICVPFVKILDPKCATREAWGEGDGGEA